MTSNTFAGRSLSSSSSQPNPETAEKIKEESTVLPQWEAGLEDKTQRITELAKLAASKATEALSELKGNFEDADGSLKERLERALKESEETLEEARRLAKGAVLPERTRAEIKTEKVHKAAEELHGSIEPAALQVHIALSPAELPPSTITA
eukprot:CAMPEP_0183333102 /NCGR_PEP_ID=MMETSP0164_2-20130417/2080_1 /TAXON_ID=221442 /ORGANISM="Coccolithus pelagicus ssp braarudi, Strain PLY182g" /LENGTH=150 /DNA_ID=CAMNT_0025501939 /DNA_START=235 /DNA_END=685 /DNA_ORIENTATION=+